MKKNNRKHSIIYKTAFSFSLMSLVTIRILSGVSYFLFSSQYIKNIKVSLVDQYQILQDEITSGEWSSSLEEQLPTLSNEWFLVSTTDANKPFYYRELYIPYTEKWFYRVSWEKGNILFYSDMVKWKDIFLGKKMDDFEKTRNDYLIILCIINISFLFVLIGFSFFLSNKILNPITQLADYLVSYRFNVDNPKILHQEGQLFEIGILTKAFDTAIRYTQQAIQKEKEFLQDASHELRTPLMWISSSVELLQTEKLTSQQEKKLNIIQLLSNKLQRITDELLFLTRWVSKWKDQKEILLWENIQTIIDWYESIIQQKDLHIISKLDASYSVLATEIHIQKVFSNLIDNAIKYTPSWWTITISLKEDMFSIQDTGIGMDTKFIWRVWERFIRQENAVKFNYEGIWLWLSIVYKILQENKWHMDITSELWKGTQFTIFFKDKNIDGK